MSVPISSGRAHTRVLRVISTLSASAGGPVEGLRRSAVAMARLGCETEVATLDPPGSPFLRDLPFATHALGPRTRAYSFSPRLVPWLRANAAGYDAVVVHGVWNYCSIGSWWALAGGRTPYAVFTHGMLDPWFRTASPLKWRAKELLWRLAESRVLRDARAVLFTTEEERVLARASFPNARYNARVVSYGTADVVGDPARQDAAFRAALPALGGRRFLLFLSRIHPKKGCDLLLRAFAAAASRDPGLDLVIAGPDETGWRPELDRIAAEGGITGRVHWPGLLTGDAKWGAFRACSGFVLPSHQENFGIVVAEAMACSAPVLITDKVNIWRDVAEAGAGLVEPDDLTGISRLLARFGDMPDEERAATGRRARAAFLSRFSIEGAAADLLAALRGEPPAPAREPVPARGLVAAGR